MAWVESISPWFRARHESEDAEDAERLLERLESTRRSLAELFSRETGEITVVIHGSTAALYLAQPYLILARGLTEPAGRRYLVGWFGARELHVLAPRLLERRASAVPGSRELLLQAPAALYASMVVGTNNPELPPPFSPASFMRYIRWAWLVHGAAQYFGGQVEHLRPAIRRRLHEGGRPSFPPGVRDAALLGGTVLDLLACEEGQPAAVRLVSRLHPEGDEAALVRAFGGRALRHTESSWRAHLERLAGPAPTSPSRR